MDGVSADERKIKSSDTEEDGRVDWTAYLSANVQGVP